MVDPALFQQSFEAGNAGRELGLTTCRLPASLFGLGGDFADSALGAVALAMHQLLELGQLGGAIAEGLIDGLMGLGRASDEVVA